MLRSMGNTRFKPVLQTKLNIDQVGRSIVLIKICMYTDIA